MAQIILMKPCNSSNPSLNISVQQYIEMKKLQQLAALDETSYFKGTQISGKNKN